MNAGEVDLFRQAIARHFGLLFDEGKTGFLSEVLDRRALATRNAPSTYLARLDGWPNEARELARELTVGETYFFRHTNQFKAFEQVAVPEVMNQGSAPFRVLSAGCSSGEEAYSLAIVLKNLGVDASWLVNGIDVNPSALEKAVAGRYSEWSLRDAPPDFRSRWFLGEGQALVLDASVRRAVTFEERNLSVDDDFWATGRFGVIFCRNVLMYFDGATAQQIVERFWRSLSPGGFLFFGHAETMRGLSNNFHLRHSHDTFYYQRKDGAPSRKPSSRPLSGWPLREDPVRPSDETSPAAANHWATEVQASSERIQALVEATSVELELTKGPIDLTSPMALLKAERFLEALDHLPPNDADDTEGLLLRAALLTHTSQLAEASRACHRLLELDSLSAEAHYLLGLCAEGTNETREAIDHHQVAAYLDASFAMPRLHLGLLARRGGDRETALRELRQALLLLQRDEPTRVSLFGGGFTREGLMSLCRAELSRLEQRA